MAWKRASSGVERGLLSEVMSDAKRLAQLWIPDGDGVLDTDVDIHVGRRESLKRLRLGGGIDEGEE